MLDDLANKLIVPSYAALDESLATLVNTIETFTNAPSQNSLEAAKASWEKAVLQWQDVVSYDFGPAETLYGNLSVNAATFPADTVGIETFIINGDTTLANYERDTRGFYGIEYLLYGTTETSLIPLYSGDSGQRRAAYLRSITRRLYNEVHTVYSEWVATFKADFISRNGTDAGSGTSQLFNAMNIGYELIKNYKLGLPLGLRAGQSASEPNKVEALYSGMSVVLIDRQYHAVMRIWEGRTLDGTKILGFRDYLQAIPNGPRLISETEQQAANVETALQAVPHTTSLRDQIVTTPQPAVTLFTEMQKLTRFLKSELSSLTGLAITYASGDGD